ncbi:hypothetical protein SAMN02927900_03584 [Rhizobium mongolense subsp. loessense]|uniref:Uncharacterized protein n=1 Tax=Rhizobium mongolense subsp. loessense TaxID=158890 RepID=A0A1G4SBG8_9HYPH|nr:hypothetical protein SAMN02927900_03584 [Rhizobium mongolense subsp. loessense]
MSRYTITVTTAASRHSDPDAVIGYDQPLQTFFLQAFRMKTAMTSHSGSEPNSAPLRSFAPCEQQRWRKVMISSRSRRAHSGSCSTTTRAKAFDPCRRESSRITPELPGSSGPPQPDRDGDPGQSASPRKRTRIRYSIYNNAVSGGIFIHKDTIIAGTTYLWRPACPAQVVPIRQAIFPGNLAISSPRHCAIQSRSPNATSRASCFSTSMITNA